jgi:tyrosine-specific transport protein
MNFRFLRAYGFFAGGMIGVGIFGLPIVLQRAGLLAFLLHVVVVGILAWWIHRLYLQVVLATPGTHRLPGLARARLGNGWGTIATIANLLGLFGALVAYLLVGGRFLSLLFPPLELLGSHTSMLVYLAPGAVLLLVGLHALPVIELVICILFIGVLVALPIVSRQQLSPTQVALTGHVGDAFLPYGVLLFGYWGISLVIETAELVRRRSRPARRVIAAGMITAACTYLVFAVTVAALTGTSTSEDALTGLRAFFGDGIVTLTLIFGLLATFSSYLALGLSLLRTLEIDFRVPRIAAWALTTFVPVMLVLGGVRSLLAVLGVTGALFLGVEGLVVVRLASQLTRAVTLRERWVRIIVSALLVVGVVGEIVYQVFI